MEVDVHEVGGVRYGGCVYIVPFFGVLNGLMTHYIPQEGSTVALVGANPPFVLGLRANLPSDDRTAGSPATAGAEQAARASWNFTQQGRRGVSARAQPFPSDLVPGELSLANAQKVGMDFLATMARVKAGDLAFIEACLLDNTVRMVSQTFAHFSAFGRHEIYRKGNTIDVVMQGSGLERDRWDTESDLAPRGGKGKDSKLATEKAKMREEGRVRFTALMGNLGGFINLFVHDPIATLRSTSPYTDNYPSGRFRAHVGQEGSLLVQSTDEIIFERVNRIAVPVRLKTWNDPTGTPAKVLANLSKDAENVWRMTGDETNPFQSCFQIRQQARWISSYHSVAKFWAMTEQEKKDWILPTEDNVNEPTTGVGIQELEELAVEFVETYATFRIMRDGSVMTIAGDGSYSLLGNGDIRFGCPKNFIVEAGGSIIFTAGQDIIHRARRNLELTADIGKALLRGALGLRLFADKGPVHLRGVANPTIAKVGSDTDDPVPDWLTAGLGAAARNYGVIIASEKGGMRVEAAGRTDVVGTGDFNVTTKSFSLHAKGDVLLASDESFLIRARKGMIQQASNLVFNIASNLIRFSDSMILRPQGLHVGQVKALAIYSDNVETSGGTVGKKPDATDRFDFKRWADTDQPELTAKGWAVPLPTGKTQTADLTLSAPALSSYVIDAAPSMSTVSSPEFISATYLPDAALYQGLTEQLVGVTLDETKFSSWNLNTSGALAFAIKGKNTIPYPGSQAQRLVSRDTAQRLDKPATTVPQTPGAKGWLGKPMSAASFSGYKFLKSTNLDKARSDLIKD